MSREPTSRAEIAPLSPETGSRTVTLEITFQGTVEDYYQWLELIDHLENYGFKILGLTPERMKKIIDKLDDEKTIAFPNVDERKVGSLEKIIRTKFPEYLNNFLIKTTPA